MTTTERASATIDASIPRPEFILTFGSARERDPQALTYLGSGDHSLNSLVVALFDCSDDCIKVIGLDGSLQLMNCNGQQALEIDNFLLVAGTQWQEFWPK